MKIIDIKKENEIFNKKKDISCSENKDKDKDKIYSLKSNSSKDQFQDLIETQKYLSTYCKEFNEKFELLELIKSGSAGAVFRGHLRNNTRQNSKQIAFKFLFDNNREYHDIKNKEKKTNEKSRKKDKFQHMEISIHGMLKYKHIPEIYGYYKIENSSCIAMEFNKYGDLENFKKKVLKRASLSETLVLYIAGGIIEALNYIHTNNKIIHMDIKQQNVLIDDVNEASKIDIYSLGVLLYLLAFYDYPYNLNDVGSKDYAQIAKNIAQKELEFPQDTGHSKLFINFLRNCLNKDIKKRYDIHQVMKDPWFKGYSIILNEKEKLYNAGKFIIDLMVDNLLTFNNYLKEQESLL